MAMRNKRGLEMDMLGWYIIGALVLIVALVSYFILRDKMSGAIEFIKNIIRAGR